MLFSKLKHKDEELLPPPPPFPSMGIEEKPDISETKLKKAKAKDKDFEDLFREVESLKSKKEAKTPIIKAEKKPKIPKKIELKPVQKVLAKKAPARKAASIKLKVKAPIKRTPVPKAKMPLPFKKLRIAAKPKLPEKKLEDLDLLIPKTPEREISMPEEPEELEFPEPMEGFGKEFEAKPKEIQEAEDEIKSAIEKIKEREKPSLFQKLFAKEKPEYQPAVYEKDDVTAIQNMINKARQSLMKFDLETAKRNYIELMRIYNKIKPEEQAKVYHEIRDLYFERKSAEELKV